MNIFILLGTLLFFGALALLFFCFVALLIIAFKKRSWKFAYWSIGGTVAASAALVGLFIGLAYLWFRPYDPTSTADLKKAYQAEFGTLPPAGVTVLKARQIVIADSGAQWLLLQVAPDQIDKHIGMGFTKTEETPLEFLGPPGPNAPKWWTPPATGLEFYSNTNWSKAGGWYHSEASMGIDRASQTIWFIALKSH